MLISGGCSGQPRPRPFIALPFLRIQTGMDSQIEERSIETPWIKLLAQRRSSRGEQGWGSIAADFSRRLRDSALAACVAFVPTPRSHNQNHARHIKQIPNSTWPGRLSAKANVVEHQFSRPEPDAGDRLEAEPF